MMSALDPAKISIADAPWSKDVGFALGVLAILLVLFVPLPPILMDLGLAVSMALSILILMVALWIEKRLEFSSFPTILLISTMLRLALNIATTRLILSNGADGTHAAGNVIAGFAGFVMGDDFVIGIVVFVILITVNFLVITKGATRMAEVSARFTLDAIPGKQMAIDADLSSGTIDEKEAQRRRRELEEESSFFGAMDGASKFVRGDAVAGIVITAINIFGGIIIGTTRNGMSLGEASDTFVRLAVGDGLVTQIPALIISLAAGLLISKGDNRGTVESAILGQFGLYPKALMMAAVVMFGLGLTPGLPLLPFHILAILLLLVSYIISSRRTAAAAVALAHAAEEQAQAVEDTRNSLKETLRTPEIEVALGRQLGTSLLASHGELSSRVTKMRRKFAEQYGFVIPEIKLSDDLEIAPKSYCIRIAGTVVARGELRIGEMLVVVGDDKGPNVPGDDVIEPAFGMKAKWVPDVLGPKLRRDGFTPIDVVSVLLTHLAEVIRNNLAQLFSYRDVRRVVDGLDPEYRRLLEEIVPTNISFSSLQSVFKLLLAERVSIRNINRILEGIAEIVPHSRRPEQIAEHVRSRLASQLCGELSDGTKLKVLRLGARWELAFHQALKRDAKGEIVEFDIDPRMIEQFGIELSKSMEVLTDKGHKFALIVSPEARPFVRMLTERLFATLPVLSHAEIARGIQLEPLGAIS